MSRLNISFDWIDGSQIQGAELAETLASLEVRIDGKVVTRVLDARAKTVRNRIFAPIYPLAEWLAVNWWFLNHELENPAKENTPAFRRRHALGANLEGYAYPNLAVMPSGRQTRLVWQPSESQWGYVEFLSQGEAWLDTSEFQQACKDVIEGTIFRLLSRDVEKTLLQQEWEAIQAADKDESQFCETVAGLGLDPYALDSQLEKWIIQLANRFDHSVLPEAIAAVDPDAVEEGMLSIERAFDWAKTSGSPLNNIDHLRTSTDFAPPPHSPHPWEVGYQLARRVREALNLDGTPLPSLPALADALGESQESLENTTRPMDFPGASLVDGLTTRNPDAAPTFAFRSLRQENRNFHLCRALGDFLKRSSPSTLITRARSANQQFNRAFAAEFLAPSTSLRTGVSGSVIDEDEVGELAVEYGVSSWVIAHQVTNHKIARVWQ